MIVISSSFVLSDEDFPLCHPIVGWHNLVTVDNITAATEEDDYPATNLANPSTNLLWRGTGADSPSATDYLTVDISAYNDDIDYIAVAGHNFGSTQATVTVEYLDTDDSPDTWVELVDAIPADDAPLIFRFTPETYSQVRLKIEVGSDVPEAAVLYVGKLLVMEMGTQEFTPLPFGRQRDIVTGTSESGDYLGRIQVGGRLLSSPSFIGLTPSWVREELDGFLEASATTPFFFSWNPEDHPYETGFAWMTDEPVPSFDIDGYVSVTFNMAGILD